MLYFLSLGISVSRVRLYVFVFLSYLTNINKAIYRSYTEHRFTGNANISKATRSSQFPSRLFYWMGMKNRINEMCAEIGNGEVDDGHK